VRSDIERRVAALLDELGVTIVRRETGMLATKRSWALSGCSPTAREGDPRTMRGGDLSATRWTIWACVTPVWCVGAACELAPHPAIHSTPPAASNAPPRLALAETALPARLRWIQANHTSPATVRITATKKFSLKPRM
jgi:hypothetical protein